MPSTSMGWEKGSSRRAQWLNTVVAYVLMEDAVLDGVTVQLAIPTEPKPGATLQTVVRCGRGLNPLVNGGSFKDLPTASSHRTWMTTGAGTLAKARDGQAMRTGKASGMRMRASG